MAMIPVSLTLSPFETAELRRLSRSRRAPLHTIMALYLAVLHNAPPYGLERVHRLQAFILKLRDSRAFTNR